MWKCPPLNQNVKSNFSRILFPSIERPLRRRKTIFWFLRAEAIPPFCYPVIFIDLCTFGGDSSLFNVKLDAEPKVGILQFKAKEQKNSQDVSVTSDPILVKASLGSNMRCSIIIWNQGRKLKDGTVLGKQRIFMCDVSSWNDVFKLSFYAVVFFLASV